MTRPDYLCHHGIKNQRWGVRNGPPYPLGGGDYSSEEMSALKKERRFPNSLYKKKHFDTVIKEGTTLSTLSRDSERTSKGDMFYATYKSLDKAQYNVMFNSPAKGDIKDENGNVIGDSRFLKYRIDNTVLRDIKVASEDSGANSFGKLYKKDRDFYNFVTDPDRMQKYFGKGKLKFRGYRESKEALEKIRNENRPSESDIKTIYRMFNYVLPNDGNGDAKIATDVGRQRAKFFKELKQAGYGAVLDTNDAIYGSFKASAPVIVFDKESVALQGSKMTTLSSKQFDKMKLIGRSVLGM